MTDHADHIGAYKAAEKVTTEEKQEEQKEQETLERICTGTSTAWSRPAQTTLIPLPVSHGCQTQPDNVHNYKPQHSDRSNAVIFYQVKQIGKVPQVYNM